MRQIYLGDKFYKYIEEEDRIEIVRIIKMKNTETFIIEREDTKDKFKINRDRLLSEFTRLKSDGFISFAIVNLQDNLKDVIVSLYRSKDIDNKVALPYAACRQNIFDLFSSQIKREGINSDVTYIGISVSVDTIPEDTPYEMVLSCNGIIENTMVSVYIDDTLDSILSMIRESKYDLVLKTLNNRLSDPKIVGSCESLRDLLIYNNFMYDFHKGFNIVKVPFKVEILESYEILPEQRIYLENDLKVEMFRTYTLEYDKEINLNKIEREYILISDVNDKLYILAYDKGKYINRVYQQNIKDKRDILTMIKYSRKWKA